MTHEEAVLVSAYTGVLLTKSFKNVQDFCEKLLGRPVFTHELANEGVLKEIQEKCLPEIVKMIDPRGRWVGQRKAGVLRRQHHQRQGSGDHPKGARQRRGAGAL